MKKFSFISSILTIAGSLMLSAEASTVNENLADLIPQLQPLLKDFCEDEHLLSTRKSEVMNKPFNRLACDQAIFQKHGELFACEFSGKNRFSVMLDLGKLYYDFGKHSEDIDEKEAYYEEAQLYFRDSEIPEAETYLTEIDEYFQN